MLSTLTEGGFGSSGMGPLLLRREVATSAADRTKTRVFPKFKNLDVTETGRKAQVFASNQCSMVFVKVSIRFDSVVRCETTLSSPKAKKISKQALDALSDSDLQNRCVEVAQRRLRRKRWLRRAQRALASATVSAVMLTMRRTVAEGVRMCTGLAAPSNTGPIAMPPPAAVFSRL